MKKRIIIGVVIIVIIIIVFITLSVGVPVDTAAVSKGVISSYVDERAKTSLSHVYHITMPLTGRIEPISLNR